MISWRKCDIKTKKHLYKKIKVVFGKPFYLGDLISDPPGEEKEFYQAASQIAMEKIKELLKNEGVINDNNEYNQ